MAYLFEVLSDYFRYVYTLDFLSFMFSSIENAAIFLSWIIVIIPGMLYAAHIHKPHKFFGYISSAFLWLVCGFLVMLCPLSLLLYFLYRKLYMLCKNHKAPKNSVQAKEVPPPSVPASSSTLPAKPVAQSVSPTQNAAPPYRVCHFIWTRSIIFCEHIQQKPSLLCETYVWTVFFYSLTKHMRNQDIVDEIYAQFKSAAEPFIRDGEDKARSLNYIQLAYWRFRSTLNASGIDPRTRDGICKLWELTAQWAFPNAQFPEGIEASFSYNVQLLVNHALTLYGLKSPAETVYYMESASDMIVRVPESKLEVWEQNQERIKSNPKTAELTEQEKLLRDRIIRDIYGADGESTQ